MQLTNESQIRLTVELRGRLASMEAIKDKKTKKEKLFCTYHKASESVLINSDTVQNWISDGASAYIHVPVKDWKKMTKSQRLQAQLQYQADYLAGYTGAKFTFEVIN